MKSCAYCGKESGDAASDCIHCGTPLPETNSAEPRVLDILTEPTRLMRALVVTSVVSYVAWFFHLIVGQRLISRDLWDGLEWHGWGALLVLPEKVAYMFLLLYAVTAVGLWHFVYAARTLFLCLTLFHVITAPLYGLNVQTPIGSFLILITNLADGAVLALAFASPLKHNFK